MSKRDYEMLARILGSTDAPEQTVRAFVIWCGKDNPAFNRTVFLAAVHQWRQLPDPELLLS